jgi:hypothetical protein
MFRPVVSQQDFEMSIVLFSHHEPPRIHQLKATHPPPFNHTVSHSSLDFYPPIDKCDRLISSGTGFTHDTYQINSALYTTHLFSMTINIPNAPLNYEIIQIRHVSLPHRALVY